MTLPPASQVIALAVIFVIGMGLLGNSPSRSLPEKVGAVLTLAPVLAFILLLILEAR